MVSNVPYHSFKQIDFKGRVPFVAIVVVMLIFAIVLTEPPLVLFAGFLIYTLSGPALAIRRWIQKRRARRSAA
jgi:CDP-diacylglycerol--serine O-phosphatidyltransferase